MWQRLLGLLAVAAVLVVTLPVIPGHAHSSLPGRHCEVCHAGHVPGLQAAPSLEMHHAVAVEWRHLSEDTPEHIEPGLITSDSRAPPA